MEERKRKKKSIKSKVSARWDEVTKMGEEEEGGEKLDEMNSYYQEREKRGKGREAQIKLMDARKAGGGGGGVCVKKKMWQKGVKADGSCSVTWEWDHETKLLLPQM